MSYIENIIETAIETGKDLITRNGCRVTPAISFYKFCRVNGIKQPVQDYHFTGVVIIDGDTHIINWAKNGRYMLTGNADHYLDIVGYWEDRPMKIKIGGREINAPYLKQPNYGDMIYSPDVRYSSVNVNFSHLCSSIIWTSAESTQSRSVDATTTLLLYIKTLFRVNVSLPKTTSAPVSATCLCILSIRNPHLS